MQTPAVDLSILDKANEVARANWGGDTYTISDCLLAPND